MRVPILLATSALAICSALAQQEPPASQKPPRETTPPSSGQPSEATTDKTQPGTSTSSAQSEMKLQTYKGVLVDASCAMPQSGAATTSRSQGSPTATTPGAAGAAVNPGSSGAAPGTADRAAGDQACPASSSTNQFALKLQDGRTMRFDIVGNDRAQEAVKNKKKWSEAASSGNTINATVKGVIVGSKLIVSSIN